MHEFKEKSLVSEKVLLKQFKAKQKNKEVGSLNMLLGTLDTSLLKNILKLQMWLELVKQQQQWAKEHTEQQ